MTMSVDELAKVIWDYHHLNQPLEKADCILVLGSYDKTIAEYAADLFLQGWGSWMVFSGAFGHYTKGAFKKTEAETFAEIAKAKGVPDNRIIIENKSTNTGENILFIKNLIEELHLDFKKFIVVQKPYMERRVFATFKKVWPEKEFIVTSMPVSYEDYIKLGDKDRHINGMVADLQRIKLYPDKGFQVYQEIPLEVWSAYEQLVALGYNKRLIQ